MGATRSAAIGIYICTNLYLKCVFIGEYIDYNWEHSCVDLELCSNKYKYEAKMQNGALLEVAMLNCISCSYLYICLFICMLYVFLYIFCIYICIASVTGRGKDRSQWQQRGQISDATLQVTAFHAFQYITFHITLHFRLNYITLH